MAVRDAVPGGRRPSLADVAALAGVSPQSVSRILLGHDGHAVATRDRVLAAARTLGYASDPNARALALRRLAGGGAGCAYDDLSTLVKAAGREATRLAAQAGREPSSTTATADRERLDDALRACHELGALVDRILAGLPACEERQRPCGRCRSTVEPG